MVAALVGAGAAGASADESATGAPAPTLAVEGHVGLGTPLGEGGVMIDWAPSERVSVGAGAGLGLAGPQVAIMPRLTFGALELGAGLSGGPYRWDEFLCFDEPCAAKRASLAVWGNLEVGIRARLGHTWRIRPYAGYSLMLNRDALDCTGDADQVAHCESSHRLDGGKLPYVGVGVGRSF